MCTLAGEDNLIPAKPVTLYVSDLMVPEPEAALPKPQFHSQARVLPLMANRNAAKIHIKKMFEPIVALRMFSIKRCS